MQVELQYRSRSGDIRSAPLTASTLSPKMERMRASKSGIFFALSAFRHQPSDHTPALGNLDLFPLEQEAFNLLELAA
jgi:hypothetical protein